MQKYLILIGSLKKGGAERNAALLANHLTSNGNKVCMVTFTNEVAFHIDDRVDFIQINHQKYKITLLNILYIIYKLRCIVNSIKPKRLITMSRIAGLFASAIFFKNTIVRFDSYPLIGYKKTKQRQFWFFYNLPWVRYVVCPSEELKEDVQKYFLRKEKLKAIYNSIPKNDENYSQFSKIEVNKQYFIIVSRLHKQKNIDKIIETFYKYNIYEKADLMVLGDGPEITNLNNLVWKLGLNDSVKFLGFIKDPLPYIHNSIALLSASLREGFPNVLIEALSVGTPVISSAAKTGPKEIIFDGDNGLLFPPNDYKRLGEHMHEIISNTKTYMWLKSNTSKGLERFSQQNVMESWGKIL